MNMITQIHPTIPLSNGIQMPAIGLGVLKAQDGDEVTYAVQSAIEQGYRLIDTASIYRNESGVGQGLQNAAVPRKDVFLTTKVWNNEQGYEQTLQAFEQSLKRLQTDYLDLYLIHWPVKGKYKDTWRALEQLYRDGRVRAIGVSNFQVHHLEDLLIDANIRPMVNQVEMHPYLQQADLLDFAQKNHIRLEAWRPIMQGQVNQVPELQMIGAKYGKSPVQVTLRWLYQLGVIVIPKSVNAERIGQNADIFDFELSHQEMSLIRQLDQGQRLGPDPDNFNF